MTFARNLRSRVTKNLNIEESSSKNLDRSRDAVALSKKPPLDSHVALVKNSPHGQIVAVVKKTANWCGIKKEMTPTDTNLIRPNSLNIRQN